MYLEHFKFREFPFALTPSTNFFCSLPVYKEALNTLIVGLYNGEGFIKIIGEVGTGKTLLCRKLLNSLTKGFVTAYIPNPDLSPDGIRKAFAKELGVEFSDQADQYELLNLLTGKLLWLHGEGKRVVLIIDEAQTLSDRNLEAVRLLSNLETESAKLLQIVLFAQPELDERLRQPNLRQLQQRITFSYHLAPLRRGELDAYLCHRLAIAGYDQNYLFSPKACDLLARASRGIPRIINMLCHKALLVTYGYGDNLVEKSSMRKAIQDTECAEKSFDFNVGYMTAAVLLLLGLALTLKYYNIY